MTLGEQAGELILLLDNFWILEAKLRKIYEEWKLYFPFLKEIEFRF